ncbi:MAG: PilZ domain-containing protein [Alphaproteobacteria bacterium]|nr:PilZ domain-containing protein [Alphaproteobacteria bacterium]
MSEAGLKTAIVQVLPPDAQDGAESGRKVDRRLAPRRRVLKGAQAVFLNGHCSIPCMVRDISTSGARIKSMHSAHIPDHFQLVIELDGIEVQCEAVWRKSGEIGVRFLAPPSNHQPKRHQVVTAVVFEKKPTLRRRK